MALSPSCDGPGGRGSVVPAGLGRSWDVWCGLVRSAAVSRGSPGRLDERRCPAMPLSVAFPLYSRRSARPLGGIATHEHSAVALAQWQSSGLWNRRLRVRAPQATPTPGRLDRHLPASRLLHGGGPQACRQLVPVTFTRLSLRRLGFVGFMTVRDLLDEHRRSVPRLNADGPVGGVYVALLDGSTSVETRQQAGARPYVGLAPLAVDVPAHQHGSSLSCCLSARRAGVTRLVGVS